MDTIKYYLQNSEGHRRDETTKFTHAIKENKKRVVKYYDSRIEDFRHGEHG